jgi:ribosomal protein S18 acetylase RimI-like enzyme
MPVSDAVQKLPDDRLDPSSAALLDNPIWSALTTDHASLALGGGAARRYPEEIGPLSGMPAQSGEGYAALRLLVPMGGTAALFLRETPRPPQEWTLVRGGQIVQMVALHPVLAGAALPADAALRTLTAADAPAMVELAELTEPGPFRLGTIELGGYLGIFQSGRLAAMAGRRMSMPGFVEVSAVCTHPEARGRGYASVVTSSVIEEILRAGRVPFLHALPDNPAIRIYERLGFVLRQSFELAVVRLG